MMRPLKYITLHISIVFRKYQASVLRYSQGPEALYAEYKYNTIEKKNLTKPIGVLYLAGLFLILRKS